jgi:hypothetical protein
MNSALSPLRVIVVLLALSALSAIGFGWIAAPPRAANQALEEAMRQINDSMKVLGKGVNAENRAESLLELAKFQAALLSAKAQTPDSAEKVEEKKRAAFVNDFRKTLVEGLQFSCSAEIAIVDGKYKEADTLIRNKLGALKAEGHSKFKPDAGK